MSPPPPPLPLRLWPRQARGPRPTSQTQRSPSLSQTPLRASERRGMGRGPCVRPRSSVPTSNLSSVPATNSPAAVRTSGGSHTAHHHRASSGGGCQRRQTRTHTQRESKGTERGQKRKVGHPTRGRKGVGPCLPSPEPQPVPAVPRGAQEHLGKGVRTRALLGPRGARAARGRGLSPHLPARSAGGPGSSCPGHQAGCSGIKRAAPSPRTLDLRHHRPPAACLARKTRLRSSP